MMTLLVVTLLTGWLPVCDTWLTKAQQAFLTGLPSS